MSLMRESFNPFLKVHCDNIGHEQTSLLVFGMLGGEAKIKLLDKEIILSPGNIVFCREEDFYFDESLFSKSKYIKLYIEGDLVKIVLKEKLEKKEQFCPFYAEELLAVKEILERKKSEPQDISAAGYSILMILHKSGISLPTDTIGYPDVVEAALGIIHDESVYLDGVAEIAERLDISIEHLSRTFKRFLGIPISKYLRKVKIEESKELLLDKDLSLVSIANICGYTDENSFAKAFKAETGITPSSYRKTMKSSNLIKNSMNIKKYSIFYSL